MAFKLLDCTLAKFHPLHSKTEDELSDHLFQLHLANLEKVKQSNPKEFIYNVTLDNNDAS
jgi:hypothetical protein